MRYRVSAIIIAVMVLAGLSAPAAFADQVQLQLPVGCTVGNTYDVSSTIMVNANPSVGIAYHGVGNQVRVSNTPGDSSFICVASPNTYVIRNAAGNCLRMRDASNNYAVVEENGCQNDNASDQFQANDGGDGSYQFVNVGSGRWLGIIGIHCTPGNDSLVSGVPNSPGNCDSWNMQSVTVNPQARATRVQQDFNTLPRG
ncbi:MAG TPA: RICIN domain-containing protein [Streptosporangiaceae bacterium]|nr:RICIN domain-containing protein [Streptosporangiaceae bacterium]